MVTVGVLKPDSVAAGRTRTGSRARPRSTPGAALGPCALSPGLGDPGSLRPPVRRAPKGPSRPRGAHGLASPVRTAALPRAPRAQPVPSAACVLALRRDVSSGRDPRPGPVSPGALGPRPVRPGPLRPRARRPLLPGARLSAGPSGAPRPSANPSVHRPSPGAAAPTAPGSPTLTCGGGLAVRSGVPVADPAP